MKIAAALMLLAMTETINQRGIMKYKIVLESSAEKLESTVNRLIEDGFLPVGGVSVVLFRLKILYHQAMVKK